MKKLLILLGAAVVMLMLMALRTTNHNVTSIKTG